MISILNMDKVYVFLNGELKGNIGYYENLIGQSHVYCGDGGANHIKDSQLIPKEIWGDMDSIEGSNLSGWEGQGVVLNSFSKYKNFTDGELIIDYLSSKYDRVVVIGALGGRLDHELTNINLLFKYSNLRFISEVEEIYAVGKEFILECQLGTTVSFIPFTDVVEELVLEGYEYPLDRYELKRGDSRCMSNVVVGRNRGSYKSGKLLCIVQK